MGSSETTLIVTHALKEEYRMGNGFMCGALDSPDRRWQFDWTLRTITCSTCYERVAAALTERALNKAEEVYVGTGVAGPMYVRKP